MCLWLSAHREQMHYGTTQCKWLTDCYNDAGDSCD